VELVDTDLGPLLIDRPPVEGSRAYRVVARWLEVQEAALGQLRCSRAEAVRVANGVVFGTRAAAHV